MILQGDICYHTFKPPDKRRPVLVLTRNEAIANLNALTVAPITTTFRDIPSYVVLTPEEDRVAEESAVSLDNIQTVQKDKLGKVITSLSPERMRQVREAIEFVFDFEKF